MKKLLFLQFILLLLLISCTEKNSLTEVNNKANLTIQVLDLNGKGIPKSLVTVNHFVPQNYINIFSDSTNEKGEAKPGKILEGNYCVSCTALFEGIEYCASKSFQIVAGNDKTISLSPFLNKIDKFRIFVVNKKDEPISGINVAFISHPHMLPDYYTKFNELIEDAYWIEKTDNDGFASFVNVPSCFLYSALIYWDSTRYVYPSDSFDAYSSNPTKYTVDL